MRRTDFFEKLKKDKRVIILVGIGILGILLLLFSETGTTAKKDSGEALPYGEKAEKELEERLESLLSGVSGVGRVKVMVTLDGTWESVYAKDGENKENGEKNR